MYVVCMSVSLVKSQVCACVHLRACVRVSVYVAATFEKEIGRAHV